MISDLIAWEKSLHALAWVSSSEKHILYITLTKKKKKKREQTKLYINIWMTEIGELYIYRILTLENLNDGKVFYLYHWQHDANGSSSPTATNY